MTATAAITATATMTKAHAPCEEIDNRLAYRIGYPMLPVLPVETLRPYGTPAIQDNTAFNMRINDILSNLIEFKIHGFVHRFPRGASPTGTLTFLVTSRHVLGSQAEWRMCVLELRRFIIEETKTQVAVEIVDRTVAFSSPIPKVIDFRQEDVITAASKLLPKVTDLIGQHQWISIDVLRWYFPYSYPAYQPAIVICARDASETLWWSDTLPKIRKVLEQAGGHLKVALLYLDSLTLMMDKLPDANMSSDAEPNTWPEPDPNITEGMYKSTGVTIGTSCGLKGSENSGTLGGAVQLNKDGKTYDCGLTNCHVLLADTNVDLKQPLTPNPRFGGMKAMSPSDQDHKFVSAKRKKGFKEAERLYKGYYREWCNVTEKEEDVGSKKDEKEVAWKRLKEAEDFGNRREMGTIFAASGYTTCSLGETTNDYGLDWGLIWLNPHCKINNVIPDLPKDASIPANTRIDTWMPIGIRDTYRVAKRGRTSQWTLGSIGPLLSKLKPFYLGLEDPSNMVQDTIRIGDVTHNNGPIVAHCIVAERKGKKDFMQRGDSGSLVLLAPKEGENDLGPAGTIVGLCYASNISTGGAYMMTMESVIESINKVTGGTVTMPKKYVPPASK
ncbi:hypothetical protein EJ04DRAFT_564829 [Polyplosphaeria fusca]|uniref:Uncharacterized protein n=1 Tax=Polyplosphaeria fusca TaxID=682080 RepID=A0A9P4V2Z7_9PLEO|nr:hypothetical protein EJ04DRAFT_564829 [Polyplosphaeria fusca]